MWKQRLVRLVLFVFALVIVLIGGKQIASQNQSLSLPVEPIENIGEAVMGVAGDNLSRILGQAVKENGNESVGEPVEAIQGQAQQLMESLKKLPADQLEAIKKQLLKEFCQEINREKHD